MFTFAKKQIISCIIEKNVGTNNIQAKSTSSNWCFLLVYVNKCLLFSGIVEEETYVEIHSA